MSASPPTPSLLPPLPCSFLPMALPLSSPATCGRREGRWRRRIRVEEPQPAPTSFALPRSSVLVGVEVRWPPLPLLRRPLPCFER
jgi:hypothetical protein